MKSRLIFPAIALAALAAAGIVAGAAQASPGCTAEPKDKWMSEEAMKKKVAEDGYKDIRTFKISGSCYEIYGRTADGKKAEVYFNPVTGAAVERNIEGKEHEEREKD